MKYKIKVGVSNHHVHLNKETYNQLFEEEIEIDRNLHQIGEFAAKQFVSLKTEKGVIERVRVVGPLRNYNQVEISNSDAYRLGLNPPVRKSGDIKNSENITIIGPKGEVFLESVCILAERHVHLNVKEQKELNVKDEQEVKIIVDGPRSAILSARFKVSENGYQELHLDLDEANALLLKEGDEVTIEI